MRVGVLKGAPTFKMILDYLDFLDYQDFLDYLVFLWKNFGIITISR